MLRKLIRLALESNEAKPKDQSKAAFKRKALSLKGVFRASVAVCLFSWLSVVGLDVDACAVGVYFGLVRS